MVLGSGLIKFQLLTIAIGEKTSCRGRRDGVFEFVGGAGLEYLCSGHLLPKYRYFCILCLEFNGLIKDVVISRTLPISTEKRNNIPEL